MPVQLIPYFQYTVHTVIATLFMGLTSWQNGRCGFYDASICVDPESLVTPWLVMYWHNVIVRSFRRAHALLGRMFDLNEVRSTKSRIAWHEVKSYFWALDCHPRRPWWHKFQALLYRYSRNTGQFLFGKPSQQRTATD
ncbi:MAG: hypothetical protein DRH90_15505 [Deltaproteobacteria bacterium]|nr:MAG: hypothetical protein DRH90_15505 [Deltaproteobacteria bacterium]RLC15107.1 MAG: hypothetical protein DRI24_11795 [Deltaproteobacteria bacterium]RLE03335.1 MAG: hypothetical protein DRJ13_04625 [Bacteroidota bacterium]